ncbi:uncharacterized protein armc5 [Anguilla rostrata]
MFAVHGNGQHAKRTATSREASAPESSLSWCLTQLSKAGPAASAQTDGGGQPDRGGEERAKEAERRAQAGLWRALVAIRTRHIKGGSAGIARYRARGGLPPLLEVLRHPGCQRKTQDLVLSILANCCTEGESRTQVRKLGGIGHVVAILKNVPVDSVQNRAARALGNLAMDPQNSALIHSAGGVAPLILCLSPPSSSSSSSSSTSSSPCPAPAATPCPKLECAQSAARALLYLSDTPANRLSVLSQGAVAALALLLGPEHPAGLRRASLRALGELTRGCTPECAREVSRSGALAQLAALALDPGAPALAEAALRTLAGLCAQGCLRPLVGSLGVIGKFTEEVKRSGAKSGPFLRALCLCCKEAVNRVKVKESGGLEALIGFLSANQSHPLSRLAVLAFVDFVYDESAMEQLQGLGLVPLLVSRLVALAKGEETAGGEADAALPSSPSELMDTSCFDSFDFPPPEGHRREEAGKEPGQGSSSFLSLRSWLLSEGLISCEGELLSPSGGGEGSWSSLCASFSPPAPLSEGPSPLACPSPTLAVPLHSSSPVCQAPLTPGPAPSPGPTPAPASAPTPATTPAPASAPTPAATPGSAPAPASAPTPAPTPPPATTPGSALPSSYHKRAAASASTPLPPPPLALQQSPHKPVSSPPSQPSPPPKKQPQTRSGAPSSAPPPDTPPGPPYQHPYHPEPWTSESPILLLLSRFSQSMDPSAALVHSGVLPGLLCYLTQRQDPSARCFRMLGRLSCNPNCLQGLVRTGAAVLLRLRLCLREGLKEGDRQTDRVKASTQQLGKALLNNLRLQCESSFGSGVLSHIMLSGSDTDRLYCTLSLPLLTSNKLLQKKLLLDNGGLQSALEHIGWHDDSKDHTLGFWKSLASWLHPPQPATPGRLCSLYFLLLSECLSCLMGPSRLDPNKQPSSWLGSATGAGVSQNNVSVPLISESPSPPPSKKPCLACPYLDSDFDVVFLLDDGSRFAASEDAVAGGDGSERVGSEYFRALLKGGFGEAQRRSGEGIPIRDVTAQMLLPVLHYLHGCCVSPREEMGTVGQIEGQKGTGGSRPRGHCAVLGSLAVGGLGQSSSEEREGFQNSPLAEAMVGASMFLVSGLQEELEALCVSLLQSHSVSRPISVTSEPEARLVSKADCRLQPNTPESAGRRGPESACGRGSGKDLSSDPDGDVVAPVESRKQAVGSGVQQGHSANQQGQLQPRSELVMGKAPEVGIRRKPNTPCVLNLELRAKRSIGSAFKASDVHLDSIVAWGSATRLDSELLSESDNLDSGLLEQARSGSPTRLNCQLLLEGVADAAAGSEASSNSEPPPGAPTVERGTELASNEDVRPWLGSGESSHDSPGAGSATKPVDVMKTELNSGSRSRSESGSVSGMKLDSGCKWSSDPGPDFITVDKITSHFHFGPSQDSEPGLKPLSGLWRTSALDHKTERLSRAMSKSCCLSDRSPGTESGSAPQKDGAPDLKADPHSPDPTAEPGNTSPIRSGQASGSQSRQDSKASSPSDLKLAKPSGPKLDLSSRLESMPGTGRGSPAAPGRAPRPMPDTDREWQSLVAVLPELYRFSQLHNYLRLRQMCLSVLLWQQRTSPQLPLSLAADCLSKLARRSHCIETLKRDILLLVTLALS